MVSYEYIIDAALPTFLIISNIHGNETIGYYIIQSFISELEEGHYAEFDNKINFIIIPSVNPDGFFANTRHTATMVDPNRDYVADQSIETTQFKQYFESISNKYNMCLSIHLHGGALCVSYPLDAHPQKLNQYAKSSLDEYYINASKVYAQNHSTMVDQYTSNGGYINGADWYHIDGSIQDWLVEIGVPSITLELSRVKNPLNVNVDASELPMASKTVVASFWTQNKMALLQLIQYCIDNPLPVRRKAKGDGAAFTTRRKGVSPHLTQFVRRVCI